MLWGLAEAMVPRLSFSKMLMLWGVVGVLQVQFESSWACNSPKVLGPDVFDIYHKLD